MEALDLEPSVYEWEMDYSKAFDEEVEDALEVEDSPHLRLDEVKEYKTLNYGVVGLGDLGSKLALLLSNCNLAVVVWSRNISEEKKTELITKAKPNSIRFASSARDLVTQTECIFNCLPDEKAIDEVFKPMFTFFHKKLYIECAVLKPSFVCYTEKLLNTNGGYYMEVQFLCNGPLTIETRTIVSGMHDTAKIVMPILRNIFNHENIDYTGDSPLATLLSCTLAAKQFVDIHTTMSLLLSSDLKKEDISHLKKCCQFSLHISPETEANLFYLEEGNIQPPTIDVLEKRTKIIVNVANATGCLTILYTTILNTLNRLWEQSHRYFVW